jgi:biotin carboxyl carrier protein
MTPRLLGAVNALVLLSGLLAVTSDDGRARLAPAATPRAVSTTAPPATSSPTTLPSEPVAATEPPPPPPAAEPLAAPAPPAPPAPAPPPPPAPRTVTATGFAPYAAVGPVALHYPGDAVEVVGYHQSGHDGAQPQQALAGGAPALVLPSRGRDTHPQGAADIVVDPSRQVRSPVTGTVLRAGTYTLYCNHTDHYLVVEPDARPGWEVKVLHFDGLRVARGDRVEAGVTVVGTGARLLPFRSQVDAETGEPSWPHVHVEVVDPSIPDRPSGPGCP